MGTSPNGTNGQQVWHTACNVAISTFRNCFYQGCRKGGSRGPAPKCVFNMHTTNKVCDSCSGHCLSWDLLAFASTQHGFPYSKSVVQEATFTFRLKALEGRCVISKITFSSSRVRDEGVAGKTGREECYHDKGPTKTFNLASRQINDFHLSAPKKFDCLLSTRLVLEKLVFVPETWWQDEPSTYIQKRWNSSRFFRNGFSLR